MKRKGSLCGFTLALALLLCRSMGTAADQADQSKRALNGSVTTKTKAPTAQPYVWRNVEIVAGGFVTGILFSPKQADLIYARTDIGGAYRWNPAAKRWIPLTDWVSQSESNLLGVESLASDPSDPKRVYLAVGTYTQSWASNGAILRSSDQGRTWKRTDLPFKLGGNEDGRSIGERLVVDPNRNNTLYFGSRHDGLWKSDDGAAVWNKVESFPIKGRTNGVGIGFVVFDAQSGASGKPTPTLYVGVASPGVTLYRSKNGGETWEPVPGQPEKLLPHHAVLASDGTLYLTYGNNPGPNGMTDGAVWKLNTKSGVWTDITPVKPGSPGMGSFGYAGLTIDPAHPGTLMVTSMDKWSSGDDLYRSTDAGAHWTSLKQKAVRDSSASPFLNWGVPSAALGHWMGALALDPFHPGHVLYGTGATIWGTDDATAAAADLPTHWTVRAQGLEETAVLDLISPPEGAHLLSALADIGGFRHDDLTVSPRSGMFTNPLLNTTNSLDFAESKPALIVRVGQAGGNSPHGAVSEDGGTTWTPFASEPEGTRGGSIAVSAKGDAFVWTPDRSASYVSHDHGATWERCKGLPDGLRVISDRLQPKAFYAFDPKTATLYISADAGMTFTAKATEIPRGQGKMRALPGEQGHLWLAAGGNGLFFSANGGAAFSHLASVQEADAIGFGKAAPGRTYSALYLSGKVNAISGVFRSDDSGASWIRINDDQHQYGWIGQTLTGDPRIYGRVYLATNGRGILVADPVQPEK